MNENIRKFNVLFRRTDEEIESLLEAAEDLGLEYNEEDEYYWGDAYIDETRISAYFIDPIGEFLGETMIKFIVDGEGFATPATEETLKYFNLEE